jgi:hypothetical protein
LAAAILTICDSSVWEYVQSCKIQKDFISDERIKQEKTATHSTVHVGIDAASGRVSARASGVYVCTRGWTSQRRERRPRQRPVARSRCPTLPAPQPNCSTNLVQTRASIPYKRLRSPQPGRAWYRRLRSSGRPQPKQPERQRRSWTPGGVACHWIRICALRKND